MFGWLGACWASSHVGPRIWNIVLHLHADGRAAARVSVNGRALLPSCEGQAIERALGYIEAVLVDCRPGDQLAVRAQGPGMLRNFLPPDGQAACAWLSARADEALGAIAPATSQAASGTRPVVKDLDAIAPTAPKSSSS